MRKEIISICGIIALLLLAGCVQTGNNPANPAGNNPPTTTTKGTVHTTTLTETAGHEHHLFEQYAQKHGKTLEEAKKYYEAHALDYSVKERVKARHILLLVNDQHPDKEILEKAKALKAKVTTGNFAAIAEKESQDPGSAKRGGDLGFFEKGRRAR
jgi:hypothetical protein